MLVQNQVYLLLHEIVNFYLRNNPGPVRYWAAEVGDINKATSLSALQAVGNAQSYVFYAASKSLSFLCCDGWVGANDIVRSGR